MTTVLSLPAVGRLAQRHVRQATQPVPVEDVVAWLVNAIGLQDDRARAGVRLAEIVGRLAAVTDDEQRPCLRIPDERERAA